jgi:tetratricopeptide (TPR) repeat protein
MSHTLNLVAGLLSTARSLEKVGRDQAAMEILHRLAGFRELAPPVGEEVHSRLADLYAGREEFKAARRHLTIAMTHSPQNGAYHHRMACWIEADPDANVDRAARYYCRAVRCEPDNADYWADYGAHLLAVGRNTAGHRAVRRAFELGSHDPELVSRIGAALRDAEMWDEARQLLRRALFQSSRDRRFRALWQQHQFEQLCQRHHVDAEASAPRPAVRAAVLPFLRMTQPADPMEIDGRSIRFDGAATLPMPRQGQPAPRKRGTR